ncbi:GMC family oxidoreductase [Microbacterium sp. No. 7]|uniref:GMC family oxidoreductase n=1 Tax=Microbacterium sp. No. 7 TaxID=1714373 RepID=UPI0006D026E5|nr:GMC family oxidoreductase [Microbacterium sp. No. 7]ALJ21909.1 hypothetical protein AOA12_19200 [Microbacterium sp. No. 7]
MAVHTIVVGAGSAGGALAARLTEDPNQRVTLIEAGPDYATLDETPDDIRNADAVSTSVHDWGIRSFFVEPPESREPQIYARGRVVGGCSSVNAAIAHRGTPADAQRWVDAGLDEWNWDKVLHYYKKLETDLDYGAGDYHGGDGPVPIKRVSKDEWPPATHAMQAAAIAAGFPELEDFNVPGANGFAASARNVRDGNVRAGTLVSYLQPARGRENLTILADTFVQRVVFEDGRAVGVEVLRGDGVERIDADRVVLSAGFVQSPQILTLSGIGPAETLSALGIEPVVVNENVGRNMKDHPIVPVVGLIGQTEHHGLRAELKWTTPRGAEIGIVNDAYLFSVTMEPESLGFSVGAEAEPFTLLSILAQPTSVGWLTVVSDDVRVQPEIHSNFLGTEDDMVRMMQQVRFAYRVATTEPMASELQSVIMPTEEVVNDDDALREWLRQTLATGFHGTSTCRMGHDASTSVVSQRLAVHGVENLYVADCSALRDITSAATNLTGILIGERMADWLLDRA